MEENDAFMVMELPCERDGLTIYGQAYIPKTDQSSYPTVIISHGFNGTYTDLSFFGKELAHAGIASYLFDFCGGATNSRSEGSMLDMSVLTDVSDLNSVIDFVQKLEFVNTNQLFLMGGSQGGFVSALTAAQRPDDINGLMLIFPAFAITDNAISQYSDAEQIADQNSLFGITVEKRYFEDAMKINLYDDIVSYEKHVLLIHGDRDGLRCKHVFCHHWSYGRRCCRRKLHCEYC